MRCDDKTVHPQRQPRGLSWATDGQKAKRLHVVATHWPHPMTFSVSLGHEAKLLDIMALRPTIPDVEASSWLAGDSDIFGAGRPLKPVASEIIAILTADEAE